MESFSGECVGGPWAGQMLAHWSKTKEFFRPMMAVALPMSGAATPIEAVKVGEYRLNNFGQWHWWATEMGNAYDKLYGDR